MTWAVTTRSSPPSRCLAGRERKPSPEAGRKLRKRVVDRQLVRRGRVLRGNPIREGDSNRLVRTRTRRNSAGSILGLAVIAELFSSSGFTRSLEKSGGDRTHVYDRETITASYPLCWTQLESDTPQRRGGGGVRGLTSLVRGTVRCVTAVHSGPAHYRAVKSARPAPKRARSQMRQRCNSRDVSVRPHLWTCALRPAGPCRSNPSALRASTAPPEYTWVTSRTDHPKADSRRQKGPLMSPSGAARKNKSAYRRKSTAGRGSSPTCTHLGYRPADRGREGARPAAAMCCCPQGSVQPAGAVRSPPAAARASRAV